MIIDKNKRIKIKIFRNSDVAGIWVASHFDRYINENKFPVLGFAPNESSPLIYKYLKKFSQEGTDWSRVQSFIVNEFIGLPKNHSQLIRTQMMENLFNGVNIKEKNVYSLNASAPNLAKESSRFDNLISSKGGIDLQYLPLGKNGHLAFNEPGSSFFDLTHIAKLDEITQETFIKFNQFSSYSDIPTSAITAGINTIMKIKEVVVVSLGQEMAQATWGMLEGPMNSDVPASAMQKHRNVIFVLDRESASKLDLSKFEVDDLTNYLKDYQNNEW